MTDWLAAASTWLQSWISPDAGLAGIFASAVLSATLLPGSSEVVIAAVVTAHPDLAWWALLVATTGNLLGCLLTFAMGWGARQGLERFQRIRVTTEGPWVQNLRRWGPKALILSFVPLAGDALVLAAGWFRLNLWQCMMWIAVGKGLRYLVLVLALKGLLSFQ